MLTKFKNFTRTPVTWGGYLKLSGICFIAMMIMGAIYSVVALCNMYSDRINDLVNDLVNRIKGRNIES